MRVQNPLTYGEKLLSLVLPKERYTEARLESMFGGSEININFPKFIPVHLTYQTAFVDDAGKLQLREDVYGRDAKMYRDPQEQRAQGCRYCGRARDQTSSKPVRMPVGMYGGGGYSYGGGNNFFDWIFGGPQGGPRPYPPRATFRHRRRAIMAATAGARRSGRQVNTKRRRIIAGVFVSSNSRTEDGTGGWT